MCKQNRTATGFELAMIDRIEVGGAAPLVNTAIVDHIHANGTKYSGIKYLTLGGHIKRINAHGILSTSLSSDNNRDTVTVWSRNDNAPRCLRTGRIMEVSGGGKRRAYRSKALAAYNE